MCNNTYDTRASSRSIAGNRAEAAPFDYKENVQRTLRSIVGRTRKNNFFHLQGNAQV